MKKLLILILIPFLYSCHKKPSTPKLERIKYISKATGNEREFFVYLPSGYDNLDKKWPVLLFLHGNGERGNAKDELDYLLKNGPIYEAWIQKKDIPFIIISPQLPMYSMGEVPYIKNRKVEDIPKRLENGTPKRDEKFPTPYPMLGDYMDSVLNINENGLIDGWYMLEYDLLDIIKWSKEFLNTDKKRYYITGLSYGGFGTWWMISKHPEIFAAAAPVVGFAHPNIMEPIAKNNIPLWVFAGGRDNVVKTKYFYYSLNKLETLGHKGDLRFTIEADMGHDVWTRVYSGNDIYNWFLNFQKK